MGLEGSGLIAAIEQVQFYRLLMARTRQQGFTLVVCSRQEHLVFVGKDRSCKESDRRGCRGLPYCFGRWTQASGRKESENDKAKVAGRIV